MKDYYTLKEIIFGLRKEQLRIAEKLKLLESKLSVYNDDHYKTSSFYFDLVKDNVKLIYNLYERYDWLGNLLNVLTFNFKNIKTGRHYVEELRKLDNGDYKIGGIGGIKVTVLSDEQESFNKIIEELLNDEFVNNGSLRYIGDKVNGYDKTLWLSPTCSFCINRKDNYTSLFYNAKCDDGAVLQLSPKRSLKDVINEILEIKFPRKLFSEYIQYIIDNNDDTKKDVVIQSNERKGINEFYVNDERETFVLVKKK